MFNLAPFFRDFFLLARHTRHNEIENLETSAFFVVISIYYPLEMIHSCGSSTCIHRLDDAERRLPGTFRGEKFSQFHTCHTWMLSFWWLGLLPWVSCFGWIMYPFLCNRPPKGFLIQTMLAQKLNPETVPPLWYTLHSYRQRPTDYERRFVWYFSMEHAGGWDCFFRYQRVTSP